MSPGNGRGRPRQDGPETPAKKLSTTVTESASARSILAERTLVGDVDGRPALTILDALPPDVLTACTPPGRVRERGKGAA